VVDSETEGLKGQWSLGWKIGERLRFFQREIWVLTENWFEAWTEALTRMENLLHIQVGSWLPEKN
jgi:hypothetical protein